MEIALCYAPNPCNSPRTLCSGILRSTTICSPGVSSFFGHFTAPDGHFFWCCRRATQLGVDLSDFPNVTAHFQRMQERSSVKKLIAYENEVNERFARSAR